MLRIGLLDDDPQDLAAMKTAVKETFTADNIPWKMQIYTSGGMLLDDVTDGDETFDIVLLDIEMPEVSGFSVSSRLQDLLPDAIQIFVTDHMRYVFDAFELPTFRYIPKQQLPQRLPRALRDAAHALERMVNRQLVIRRGGSIERVPFDSIQYITRNGKNAQLHTADGTHSVRRTLTQLLENELDPDQFILIDRGIIANLAAVTAIQGSEAVVSGGRRLPISRKRLPEVKREFAAYWGRFA